ncbi:MAG: DsrE family protein [Microbacter sp.]
MEKLNILWTTDNKETFFNMLSMYVINAKKRALWQEINVIIWGASSKLAGTDTEVQAKIVEMMAQGVTVEACLACAENLGVSESLSKLGVNLRSMGQPLTDYLKADEKILTI